MTALVQHASGTAIAIGALVLVLAGFLYGYAKGRGHMRSVRERLDAPPPAPPEPIDLPPQTEALIHDALRQRKKIAAIKILRKETGLGLKDAKEYIEAMERMSRRDA